VRGQQLPLRRIQVWRPVRSHRRVRVIIHLVPKSFPSLVEAFVTPSPPHDKHSISCCRTAAASPNRNANRSRISPCDPDLGQGLHPGAVECPRGLWVSANQALASGQRLSGPALPGAREDCLRDEALRSACLPVAPARLRCCPVLLPCGAILQANNPSPREWRRTENPVHRSFRSNGYWACLKDHAPNGAPAPALYPSPASRRPVRTQLRTPNSRASGPRFLPPCTRTSRGPPRSLTVVPLIQIRGTTVRLRWGYGGMSGRWGTRFPPFHRKQR